MKQRYTYRIDDHKTATVERFSGNWYIYIYKDGEYTNEVLKCMDIEEAERFLRRQHPTAERISDTIEQGNALEKKEDNTMKKYTVKSEYADQIFGGECDTAYVEECMRNGMPEEDVMHLVREFGEEVLEQFDIEEIDEEGTVKTWYAAVMDREDNDWGHGSHDLEEAKKMARKLGKGSLVIVIDDGNDPVAVDEIDPWEDVADGIYETEEDAIKAIVWDSGVVPVNTWKYDSGVGYKLVDWDTYWREVDEAACFLFEDGAGYNGEDPDDLIETYHFNRKFAEDVCEKINEAIEEKKSRTWKVYACGGDHDGEFVAEFENEALAINYCYDHTDDYPLGHSIVDPDGNEVENW